MGVHRVENTGQLMMHMHTKNDITPSREKLIKSVREEQQSNSTSCNRTKTCRVKTKCIDMIIMMSFSKQETNQHVQSIWKEFLHFLLHCKSNLYTTD